MASSTHLNRFPGESTSYREARNQLLQAEIRLRKNLEEVATLRRQLPLGREVPQDYIFDEGSSDLEDSKTVRQTRMSELFQPGKDTLAIYSFMYGPKMKAACPACTSILDSLNGAAPHAAQRINLAVVAKNPLEKIRAHARNRGWGNLRLLSSAGNTYNHDYQGETAEGDQEPGLNIFARRKSTILITPSSAYFLQNPDRITAQSILSGPCGIFLTSRLKAAEIGALSLPTLNVLHSDVH